MSRVTAWYVERSGNASGPFATDMVLAMLRDGHLKTLDLVYKEGEPEWKPAASFPELRASTSRESQKTSAPDLAKSRAQINAYNEAQSNGQMAGGQTANVPLVTWIILRPHGSTYIQEGPFTTQAIAEGLKAGRLLYAQYIWRPGLERWARIGDLREFDRRSEMRDELPPLPPPLPDPIEAVLLEDDDDIDAEEFQVFVESSAADLTPIPTFAADGAIKGVAMGGAAAESPERRKVHREPAMDPHDLASVPWERETPVSVTVEEEADDEKEAFVSTHNASAAKVPEIPKPIVSPKPEAKPRESLDWKKLRVPLAGAGLLGVIGFASFHLLNQTANQAGGAAVVAEVPAVVVAPVAAVAAPVAPVAEPVGELQLVGMHLDRPDGQIVIQGALPQSVPAKVTFKGRLGQVVGAMNVRKTVEVRREGGEIPTLNLADLKLPAGAYTVELEAGERRSMTDIFIGNRDKKFLDQLESYLREVSADVQEQKKTLYYSAQELDTLARELGAKYGQLRGKPKEWNGYYMRWQKKFGGVGQKLSKLEKKTGDELAYPDETVALLASKQSLGETADLFAQGIKQGRDIASDALTEMIAELVRQKRTIGEMTSRPAQPGESSN